SALPPCGPLIRLKIYDPLPKKIPLKERAVCLVAGAGSNLHLLPEQVKMVAGTGIDHNLQSTPVKMVAGGCNHQYLRPANSHFPINAKSNAGRMVAKNSSFHSVLFRTAA
ncbi:hypothetical protein, partial [Pseudochrobactrum sp. B5]|uniref:hypothetical protein n=1 Tax=Pseudochrobactrum sp. B5 TaxID=1289478 RepID=UPI001AECFAEC